MADLLPVWCELTCDECNRTLAGMWSSDLHIPREQLKSMAEQEGAVLRGGDVYCKPCAAVPPLTPDQIEGSDSTMGGMENNDGR